LLSLDEPFKAYWLRDAQRGLKIKNWHSAHTVFMFFFYLFI
jgi:hypothetical protein